MNPVLAQHQKPLAQDRKIAQAFDLFDVFTFGTGWPSIKRL